MLTDNDLDRKLTVFDTQDSRVINTTSFSYSEDDVTISAHLHKKVKYSYFITGINSYSTSEDLF